MRRVTALTTLVIIGVLAAGSARPSEVGLRAGPAFTSIHGDFAEIADPDYQLGVVAGGFIAYSITPNLAISIEALYSSKGAAFTSEGTDEAGRPVTLKSNLRLQYLEVPLLVRVPILPFAAVQPYVVGGASAAFGLGAKGETEGYPDVDYGEDLKSPDYGVIGGAGLRWGSRGIVYGVEARYSSSFNDLWDFDDNLESKNHGYSLTFSVARHFGGDSDGGIASAR